MSFPNTKIDNPKKVRKSLDNKNEKVFSKIVKKH